MLNTLNLITTSLLTMGVAANATPIYDEQPLVEHADEIETNNYTEEITLSGNFTISQTNNVTVNNFYEEQAESNYNTGSLNDYKQDFTKTSNYINILGTIYITQAYVEGYASQVLESNDMLCIASYTDYLNNNNVTWNPTTKILYCFQLDPYNFNRDTNVSLGITTDFTSLTPRPSETVRLKNFYVERNVYITSEENWQTYIDRQLTSQIVNSIITDVENPNSNYYYEKNTTLLNKTTEITNQSKFTDTVNFEMTPNRTNFLFVEYTPLLDVEYFDGNDTSAYQAHNVLMINQGQDITYCFWPGANIIFRGTNIIANINYEVVDIPGLMWQILTMPFAFISQAFNLTLFPGTPYQVNISNLMLSIIAMFVFVWLIGFFFKLKG